jgi:tetratricopeptide (TPR) repeat protein
MTRTATFLAALFFGSLPLCAYSQQHAHGATATDSVGTVHFATSCSPRVESQFNRAVALLHSFEFGASIRAFNEVLAADSTCAMAHWGIALSRWSNPMAAAVRPVPLLEDGQKSVESAVRLSARATERERGYIRAVAELYDDFTRKDQQTRVLAYTQAMTDLVAKQPADTEAMIFRAIALTASAPPTDKTYANQLEAGRILEQLWVKQPNHPDIAHYIIHSYDFPALASKAQRAAEQYSVIAPSAAHALHMPSHTFTRTGMWKESIETNGKSMKVALASGSIGEALHASDYAMYAYLQLGKEQEAKAILDGLPAIAARFDPKAITGAAPPSAAVFAIAAIPARWVLERQKWTEAAALEPKATEYPYAEAMTYFARSLGASRTGDLARAKASVDSLAAIGKRLTAQGEPYWAEQVGIQHLAAQAWLDLADRRTDDALKHMREAVTREDATEKSAVTPGPLAPARELLGDLLMELHRRDEAIAEYRATLKKEPNRLHSLRAIESVHRETSGKRAP